MEKHLQVVAALQIGLSLIGILVAAILFVVIVGGGLISGDSEAITITSIVGSVLAGFFLILSIPGIIGGIGLFQRRSWARILVLIISCLDLFNIPIGTVVGVYTIWVLIQDETVKLFK
jgi:hypothetical protein